MASCNVELSQGVGRVGVILPPNAHDDEACQAGQRRSRARRCSWPGSIQQILSHLADEFVSVGKLNEADEARRNATQVLEELQAELADKPDLLAEFQRYQAELLKTDK